MNNDFSEKVSKLPKLKINFNSDNPYSDNPIN